MILDNFNLAGLESQTSQGNIKAVISALFWRWYHANEDMEIKIKKWFFNFTVKVGDLHGLFEMLFGQDPERG